MAMMFSLVASAVIILAAAVVVAVVAISAVSVAVAVPLIVLYVLADLFSFVYVLWIMTMILDLVAKNGIFVSLVFPGLLILKAIKMILLVKKNVQYYFWIDIIISIFIAYH